VTAAQLLDDCLQEAVRHWAPGSSVRFLADTAVVERWSDAKGPDVLPDGQNKAEASAAAMGDPQRTDDT